jgi:hypothetical protein
MKNLFVLPTTKPSRLQLKMDNTFHIENGQSIPLRSYQHIYIISDETFNKDSWCLHQIQHEYYLTKAYEDMALLHYKVILTTDPKLIKDGIQAINDEFLEWFVNNPSCDEVETFIFGFDDSIICHSKKYEIIIPKEELNLNCFDCNKSLQDCTCMEDTINMKQETLEDFIEKEGYPEGHTQDIWETGVRDGTAWQQERMYSEEEVSGIINKLAVDFNIPIAYRKHILEWFEQFKKK